MKTLVIGTISVVMLVALFRFHSLSLPLDGSASTGAEPMLNDAVADHLDTLAANQVDLLDQINVLERKLQALKADLDSQALTATVADSHGANQNVTIDALAAKAATDAEEDSESQTSTAHDYAFEELEADLYRDPVDGTWAADVDVAVSELVRRMGTLDLPVPELVSNTCSTRTCRLELTHTAESTVFIPALLAVEGAGEVLYRQQLIDGENRTIALVTR